MILNRISLEYLSLSYVLCISIYFTTLFALMLLHAFMHCHIILYPVSWIMESKSSVWFNLLEIELVSFLILWAMLHILCAYCQDSGRYVKLSFQLWCATEKLGWWFYVCFKTFGRDLTFNRWSFSYGFSWKRNEGLFCLTVIRVWYLQYIYKYVRCQRSKSKSI